MNMNETLPLDRDSCEINKLSSCEINKLSSTISSSHDTSDNEDGSQDFFCWENEQLTIAMLVLFIQTQDESEVFKILCSKCSELDQLAQEEIFTIDIIEDKIQHLLASYRNNNIQNEKIRDLLQVR